MLKNLGGNSGFELLGKGDDLFVLSRDGRRITVPAILLAKHVSLGKNQQERLSVLT
jgi:hypothetical protein